MNIPKTSYASMSEILRNSPLENKEADVSGKGEKTENPDKNTDAYEPSTVHRHYEFTGFPQDTVPGGTW